MKLAVGTAQFGLSYGVANVGGRVAPQDVARILARASHCGIDTIDTAAAYGDSERVLGSVGVEGWRVVTKVPPLPKDCRDGRSWVIDHLKASLDRLCIARAYGLLLHSATDLLGEQGAQVAAGLRHVRAEGLAEHTGFSLYAPDQLDDFLRVHSPQLVQAPLNVFDQRLLRSGWLDRLADAGVEVHARSVFLQGLLLMPAERRPRYFAAWPDLWRRWEQHVHASGETALSVCLGFVLAQTAVSRIVVGIDGLHHMEQILAAYSRARPIDVDTLSCSDTALIDPFNWVSA